MCMYTTSIFTFFLATYYKHKPTVFKTIKCSVYVVQNYNWYCRCQKKKCFKKSPMLEWVLFWTFYTIYTCLVDKHLSEMPCLTFFWHCTNSILTDLIFLSNFLSISLPSSLGSWWRAWSERTARFVWAKRRWGTKRIPWTTRTRWPSGGNVLTHIIVVSLQLTLNINT